MPIASQLSGAFVNTTQVWDVSDIYGIKDISPELRELLVRMYQNLNVQANVINVKTTGQFPLMETVDSNLWFPNPANNSSTAAKPEERQELQKTFLVTNVAGGSTTIAHGITVTAITTFTDFYGAASDQVGFNYYGFNSAAGAANISVVADNTNIVITNNTGITFTTVYVILKYLQS